MKFLTILTISFFIIGCGEPKKPKDPNSLQVKLEGKKEVLISIADVEKFYLAVGQFGKNNIMVLSNNSTAKRFEKITSENIGKNVEMYVKGELICSLPIQATIYDGRFVILTEDKGEKRTAELYEYLDSQL